MNPDIAFDYSPVQQDLGAGLDSSASYECPLSLSLGSGDRDAIGSTAQEPPVSLIHDEVIGPSTNDEFLRAALISPDGSHVLTASETNYLVIWDIDEELVNKRRYYPVCDISQDVTESGHSPEPPIQLQIPISIGDAIYDVAWYPCMHRDTPGSACAAVALRDHPVQLWDTDTGKLRCTYGGYNQMDELDNAYAVSFSCSGDKLITGSNRMIRVFDASTPGREYISIPTCKTRADSSGQKGIISSLAVCPDWTGTFAAGSFARSVGIYSLQTNKRVLMLRGIDFGVTHMKYAPQSSHILWVGGRKSSHISCYDLRMPKVELGRVHRDLRTNQRMRFDLDPWGRYLFTGDQNGRLLIYDAMTFELIFPSHSDMGAHGDHSMLPESDGMDCLNSVCVHPYSSILISTSGQRHFEYTDFLEPDESRMESYIANVDQQKIKNSGIQIWNLRTRSRMCNVK